MGVSGTVTVSEKVEMKVVYRKVYGGGLYHLAYFSLSTRDVLINLTQLSLIAVDYQTGKSSSE